MRSPVRRSLVLATLLALLLGVHRRLRARRPRARRRTTPRRVAGINVDATTIPQLESLMNRHRLTSVQLVQFYLHRIKKLNPKLHAVITVSPTALADARAADKARRHGDRRPLLGIPVIVKDNVDTTGMPTTAGSWALAGSNAARRVHRPAAQGRRRDHHRQGEPVASGRTSGPARRRAAGAGSAARRTWPTSSTATRAARAPAPASRASADLATVAVGTETDGSIVCPSGANGVVGIKPTLGLLEPDRHRPDLGRPGHRRPDRPQRDRRGRPPRGR